MAQTKPYVIALEEHYSDPAVVAQAKSASAPVIGNSMYARLAPMLNDLGELRLKHMDEALAHTTRWVKREQGCAVEHDFPARDLAAFWCQQAGNRFQDSALACPICPEQGNEATLRHLNRNSLDR